MNYQDFKNKYNGKYIDYDKSYGNQCWDLVQQYITECLVLPASILSGIGNVGTILEKKDRLDTLLQYFDEVPTTAMNPGDVCIWPNIPVGKGHIALFDNWDGSRNWYLSQDANARPTGVYSDVTSATGIMRAFRKKKSNTIVTTPPEIKYYPKTTYDGVSIVDGLKSIGVDSSYNNRAIIAAKNDITEYKGTAEQNTKMLNLLKNGQLKM